MELERGWMDRTGDIIFTKPEWRRVPTERFRLIVQSVLGRLNNIIDDRQIDWLDRLLYTIPDYETYNPIAIVLAFCCIGPDRNIDQTRFNRIEKFIKQSWVKSYDISLFDIIRYCERWRLWFEEDFFSENK